MAIFDNGFKVGTGVLVGLGALVLAPVVIPVAAAVVRPVAKAVIKSGIILYRKSREAIAETAEMIEDLTAEAEAELMREHGGADVIPPESGEAVNAS